VKMMTVNNMARHAMETGTIGAMNPLFGAQRAPSTSMPTSIPSFGADLQVRPNMNFSTSADVRSAAGGLQSAVQDRQTAFAQQQAVTSNANVATAAVNNSQQAQGTASSTQSGPINLDVKQTAAAQTNAGSALGADARAVDAGEYAFTVEAGGETHSFTVTVDENDTNASIQQKMADAINERGIGVNASVTATAATDGSEATTSLSLSSANTGTDAAFKVEDSVGGLASEMGVTTATQDAQNAVYSVNGGAEVTSQSNNVSLAAGVSATLTGSGSASISLARDTKSAVEGVRGLVNSINSAIDSVNASDGRGTARFAGDLRAMNQSYSASLSRMGIEVSKDGKMSIVSEELLGRAAEDGSLDRLFADQKHGLGARLDRIAGNAANTEQYADIQANFRVDQGQLVFQKLQTVGMLFNMLF